MGPVVERRHIERVLGTREQARDDELGGEDLVVLVGHEARVVRAAVQQLVVDGIRGLPGQRHAGVGDVDHVQVDHWRWVTILNGYGRRVAEV